MSHKYKRISSFGFGLALAGLVIWSSGQSWLFFESVFFGGLTLGALLSVFVNSFRDLFFMMNSVFLGFTLLILVFALTVNTWEVSSTESSAPLQLSFLFGLLFLFPIFIFSPLFFSAQSFLFKENSISKLKTEN